MEEQKTEVQQSENSNMDESSMVSNRVQEQKSATQSKLPFLIILIGLIFAGGYYFYSTQMDKVGQPITENQSVRAVVNGEELTQAMLDERLRGLQQTLTAQGIDLSNPEVKAQIEDQVLNDAIDYVVIRQAAQEANITVDPQKIQSIYDGYATQAGGEEELAKQLQTVGLTIDVFKERLAEQALVDAYIEQNVDINNIEVSDEEVKAVYDSVAPTLGENVPELEEVREQIVAQITAQKQQELLREFVDLLKQQANIEIK